VTALRRRRLKAVFEGVMMKLLIALATVALVGPAAAGPPRMPTFAVTGDYWCAEKSGPRQTRPDEWFISEKAWPLTMNYVDHGKMEDCDGDMLTVSARSFTFMHQGTDDDVMCRPLVVRPFTVRPLRYAFWSIEARCDSGEGVRIEKYVFIYYKGSLVTLAKRPSALNWGGV
jgi:hypothetical protein